MSAGKDSANSSVEPVRVKELVGAVLELVGGGNPQEIRRRAYGSLRGMTISSQNNPVTRNVLDNQLAPRPFLHTAVSFLPRCALEDNANVLLHRIRDYKDTTGVMRHMYAYALMLLYNARRRGPGVESWDITEQDADGNDIVVGRVEKKHRNILVIECEYGARGELLGWYYYSYDNVAPQAPRKNNKRKPDQRKTKARDKAVERAVKKALRLYKTRPVCEVTEYIDSLDVDIKQLVIGQHYQQRIELECKEEADRERERLPVDIEAPEMEEDDTVSAPDPKRARVSPTPSNADRIPVRLARPVREGTAKALQILEDEGEPAMKSFLGKMEREVYALVLPAIEKARYVR